MPLAGRSWSLSLWFLMTDTIPAASHTVFAVGGGSDYTVAERELLGLEFDGSATLRFTMGGAAPEVLEFSDITRSSQHMKWTLVCISLLSEKQMGVGGGLLSVRVKGSALALTSTTDVKYLGSDDLFLRGFSDGTGIMQLRIDNLRMWDRALTATEVSAGFATGAWTPAGLKLHYPFDEQAGSTAFDTVNAFPWVLTATPCVTWGGRTVSDGHAVLAGPAQASVHVPLNASSTGRPALKLTGKDWSVCMWTHLSSSAILASTLQAYFTLGSASLTPNRRGGSIFVGYNDASPDEILLAGPPFVDYTITMGPSMKGVDADHWRHACVVWRGTANGARPSRTSTLDFYLDGGKVGTAAQSTCTSSLIGTGTNFCTDLELGQSCVVRCSAGQAPSMAPPVCEQFGTNAPVLTHTPTCAALSWSTVASNDDYSQSTQDTHEPREPTACFVGDR